MTASPRSRSSDLEHGTLTVRGAQRTFVLARASSESAPLLIAFHGLGMSGLDMARFTDLGRRGPEAGCATVFPNGEQAMWDGHRRLQRAGVDDVAFVVALVAHLVAEKVARAGPVVLTGLSNGAFFAEHLARHGLIRVSVLALVAGGALEESRARSPLPCRPAMLCCFHGTADPSVPYDGGPTGGHGALGRLVGHLAGRQSGDVGPVAVGIETVASDWARANGSATAPTISTLASSEEEIAFVRLEWRAPASLPVVLYRIEGGGHGWPGGPQHLPRRLIGPVPRHLDATGILLEFANESRPDREGQARTS